MSKVEIARAAAAPDPVDRGPVGTPVRAGITQRRADSESYLAESDRVAAYEAIARLAILRRGELNLTQAEVAKRMKTTASAVSRIESGRHASTARTLKRLFEALGGHLVIGAEFSTSSGKSRQDLVVIDGGVQVPFER